MKRPRGFGLLAKVLALLGVCATAPIFVVPWGRPLAIAPQLLPLGEVATRWTLFAASLFYCGASFLCAYALWRVRPYALRAYYVWFASVAIYLAVFMFLIRIPKPLGIGIIFFGLLAAFLYFGWRIVRPVFDSDANAL